MTGPSQPQAIQDKIGTANAMRAGIVTAVATGGITVKVGGSSITIRGLGTHLPVVGDTIQVFQQGSSSVMMGAVATSSTPATISYLVGWNTRSGYAALSCQMLAGAVLLQGGMNPGTKSDGTIMGTLPAGFLPRSNVDVPVSVDAQTAQSPHFGLDTSGNIRCWGCGSASIVSVSAIYPRNT